MDAVINHLVVSEDRRRQEVEHFVGDPFRDRQQGVLAYSHCSLRSNSEFGRARIPLPVKVYFSEVRLVAQKKAVCGAGLTCGIEFGVARQIIIDLRGLLRSDCFPGESRCIGLVAETGAMPLVHISFIGRRSGRKGHSVKRLLSGQISGYWVNCALCRSWSTISGGSGMISPS